MGSRRMVLLILWLGVVGGCGELRMPKRQPIRAAGGGDAIEADIALSSNCIEVGETLTITLTLTNVTATPVTFSGKPPIDMVLERNDNAVTTAWSASSDYPNPFDPVLPAGASRTYVWLWTAQPPFAEQRGTQSGAMLRYIAPPYPYGRALLDVGVHWYSDGEYVVTCDQMR